MKQHYNVVIVEDEYPNLEMLIHLISTYFPELKIVGKADNITDADVLLQKEAIDIAFLDITLHNKNIFDILNKNTTINFQIIFITAYDKFAIDAIKTSPVDYLLKPIDTQEFIVAVNNAKQKCNEQYLYQLTAFKNISDALPSFSNKKIPIVSNNEVELVAVKDIVFLSAQRQYTTYTLLSNQEIVSSKNLGDSLKVLDASIFIRIHKSFAININHLVKIHKTEGYYCQMITGKLLPISQRKYKELLSFIKV